MVKNTHVFYKNTWLEIDYVSCICILQIHVYRNTHVVIEYTLVIFNHVCVPCIAFDTHVSRDVYIHVQNLTMYVYVYCYSSVYSSYYACYSCSSIRLALRGSIMCCQCVGQMLAKCPQDSPGFGFLRQLVGARAPQTNSFSD